MAVTILSSSPTPPKPIKTLKSPIKLKSIFNSPLSTTTTLSSLTLTSPSIASTTPHNHQMILHTLPLLDLDPSTAKVAIGFIGPVLSVFSFLFILRVVMSWYPKLPVSKFPYVIAFAPTEPFLVPTRKVIPPLAGVDITPVVWVGLTNFLSEILVGPQGLLVLLSQQQTPPPPGV